MSYLEFFKIVFDRIAASRPFSQRVLCVLMSAIVLGAWTAQLWAALGAGFLVCCFYLGAILIERKLNL